MKIINQDNNSITVEIGFLKQLSLFIRLIGGVFTVIVVASLVTEGINIISFILLLVVVLLYPLMVAKGTIVITHDALIETKRTWLKTNKVTTDITHNDEIDVLHQLTYASNGGTAKRYAYLVLKQSGPSAFGPLSLGDYFWCYYAKDENDFKKVIKLLSKNDSRKVSYDEDSSEWFSNK
jgi:hypothetical protein